ncbi:hypothetical protein COCON_G00126130 [Conger conger]|uniref:UPAR/Ly6 domain-containing protein n=1 Tax=Conger conger TaxID=82655 RepID=A0A9Q1DDH5_CONCO|nr:sperm acrosome membrane-associated protein 4 [Conger conger]KAJ8267441.1 hypothetical protein COCON_G00126130 [Conger conger]
MNRILLGIFAAGLLFAFGHTLQCYKCDVGIAGVCITRKETCEDGELCFSGEGQAASFIPINLKGCLKSDECNKVTDVSPFGNQTIYSMNKTCCSVDLCNFAPSLSSPILLPIAMATLSTSLLMSRTLV